MSGTIANQRPGKPFSKWANPHFLPDLLPVIPPVANLSVGSKVAPEMLGKVPGQYLGNDIWCGFAKFTQHVATEADIAKWNRWPGAGVGLLARNHPAIDIDVTDPALADAIQDLAFMWFGPAPVRTGNAPKRLLLYRGAPMKKRRIVFESGDAVEILGEGQHFVIDGIHPKTGQPYVWDLDPTQEELFEITEAQVDLFMEVCAALRPVKSKSDGRATERREADAKVVAADLNNLPEALLALARDDIARELQRHGGRPIVLEGSDDRAYRLAARLGDFTADGRRLDPLAAATLLHRHWAPHFDLSWLLAKTESADKHRQNDAGWDNPAAIFDPYLAAGRERQAQAILATLDPTAGTEAQIEALRPYNGRSRAASPVRARDRGVPPADTGQERERLGNDPGRPREDTRRSD